ncbi:MAG: SH3 domain-containing protein [Ruegeria sp.]
MTRVMLVTFAMLGWFFYVMSDGSDFVPRGVRTETQVAVASTNKPASRPLVAASAEPLVTAVAVQPAEPVKPAEPKKEPAPTVETVDAEAALAQVAAALNSELGSFDGNGATFSLASLDQGTAAQPLNQAETASGPADLPVTVKRELDIREVSGTRVNLRDGPGTIYPIVAKARMGQKVEVLGDSGTGWLRLRVFPEQHVGWVSSSLIRKTAN